jgi:fatty-acyl-CoA synthase
MHPDGYVKIKGRSKDIIISGGKNISSIKIKDVLYKLPEILAAAIAAKLNPKWGEGSCAFVEIKNGAIATEDEIVALSQPARARQGPKKSCSDPFQRP